MNWFQKIFAAGKPLEPKAIKRYDIMTWEEREDIRMLIFSMRAKIYGKTDPESCKLRELFIKAYNVLKSPD